MKDAEMSVAVRIITTFMLCAVIVHLPPAAARFIDSASFSTSPAADYGRGDVQLIELTSPDESMIDRRPSRRLPIGTYGFDEDYENADQLVDRSSPVAQVSIYVLLLNTNNEIHYYDNSQLTVTNCQNAVVKEHQSFV
jgi:hypothetical protein